MDGLLDEERCYRAVSSRDRRFDGVFVTAVLTTGIYCRPSCPARTPARANVRFLPTAAAAQQAGFRACKRCAPDASPGAPGWDVVADVTGRAMRLVQDGVVDREGVEGLAARLGYSSRQLNRLLRSELGAGPLDLARARRAQHARALLVETALPTASVAFAAGFGSVRQFNDTVRSVFGLTPGQLRRSTSRVRPVTETGARPARAGGAVGPGGQVSVTLPVRSPFAANALLQFLAARALPGTEVVHEEVYARTLRLPHGVGTLEADLGTPGTSGGAHVGVPVRFTLSDLRDLPAAVERTRRLLDADCDPVAVDRVLGADPLLAASVTRFPGMRVPGHVDGHEMALRAVLGQQVSEAAARTLARRLVQLLGQPVDSAVPGLTHLFPTPEAVVDLLGGPSGVRLGMPGSRVATLARVSAAVAAGELHLDRGQDRAAVLARLSDLPGIGPWTSSYLAMRALGDPDCFLGADTGTRDALALLDAGSGPGTGLTPRGAEQFAHRWRPWRSYAQVRLWHLRTEPLARPPLRAPTTVREAG